MNSSSICKAGNFPPWNIVVWCPSLQRDIMPCFAVFCRYLCTPNDSSEHHHYSSCSLLSKCLIWNQPSCVTDRLYEKSQAPTLFLYPLIFVVGRSHCKKFLGATIVESTSCRGGQDDNRPYLIRVDSSYSSYSFWAVWVTCLLLHCCHHHWYWYFTMKQFAPNWLYPWFVA